jgi:hypothetical protein
MRYDSIISGFSLEALISLWVRDAFFTLYRQHAFQIHDYVIREPDCRSRYNVQATDWAMRGLNSAWTRDFYLL